MLSQEIVVKFINVVIYTWIRVVRRLRNHPTVDDARGLPAQALGTELVRHRGALGVVEAELLGRVERVVRAGGVCVAVRLAAGLRLGDRLVNLSPDAVAGHGAHQVLAGVLT